MHIVKYLPLFHTVAFPVHTFPEALMETMPLQKYQWGMSRIQGRDSGGNLEKNHMPDQKKKEGHMK